jgi:hypothetical protein
MGMLNKILFQYPVFFGNRAGQKANFYGEFFTTMAIADPPKQIYLDFFQRDRNDDPKGIVKLII